MEVLISSFWTNWHCWDSFPVPIRLMALIGPISDTNKYADLLWIEFLSNQSIFKLLFVHIYTLWLTFNISSGGPVHRHTGAATPIKPIWYILKNPINIMDLSSKSTWKPSICPYHQLQILRPPLNISKVLMPTYLHELTLTLISERNLWLVF